MIDPEELFSVGQYLLHANADEAHRRSAISRYYYGCHLLAAKVVSLSGQDYGGGTHKKITQELANKGQKKLASDIDELCRWRNLCDYKLDKSMPSKQAKTLRKKAEMARSQLKAL